LGLSINWASGKVKRAERKCAEDDPEDFHEEFPSDRNLQVEIPNGA
jgi:hypothetical protein